MMVCFTTMKHIEFEMPLKSKLVFQFFFTPHTHFYPCQLGFLVAHLKAFTGPLGEIINL